MVEFRTDNGKRGIERVSRTATGYRMFVFNPGNSDKHSLEDDGIELSLNRGVEDSGTPFIEIDFGHMMQQSGQDAVRSLVREACQQKNLVIREVKGFGENHVCFHVDHNCMSDIIAALLLISLPSGQPLLPDHAKAFILEQQQVRHGLEQSLLNAFGQDMYARVKPSKREKQKSNVLPKSEVNRIARLVDYLRNGIKSGGNSGMPASA